MKGLEVYSQAFFVEAAGLHFRCRKSLFIKTYGNVGILIGHLIGHRHVS